MSSYWRKKYFWAALILVIALLLVAAFADRGEATSAAEVTAEVVKGSVEELVTAQGKLEPKRYVDLGAQVSGQLQRLHVEIGDRVEAGQLIAEIDPEIYLADVAGDEARLQTLRAQLLEAQAQAKLAFQIQERNKRLVDQGAVSKEVVEQSETTYKVAEAKIVSLQAQIAEAQSSLEGNKAKLNYTKIYSPLAGSVVSQSAREGETLNANQTTPTIVQVADLNEMTVRAQVAEADIPKIKIGMPLYFKTIGEQSRTWHTTVRQILPTPEILNDVILYNVLADIPNPDGRLMTSMSTQVFFVVGTAQDVPVVPTAALGRRVEGQGLRYMVQVQSGKSMEEREIEIGLRTRTQAEIRKGLAIGERVVLSAPGASQATSRMPRARSARL